MDFQAQTSFIAADPAQWLGKVVLSGQCVAYVQVACHAPQTSQWRCGAPVKGNGDIPSGIAIATFDHDGTYGNHTDGRSHAAIYLGQDAGGLIVYDQWLGQPVHQRHIRFGGAQPVNNGDMFHVVEWSGPVAASGLAPAIATAFTALPASASSLASAVTGAAPAPGLLRGFDAARDCSSIAVRAKAGGMDFIIRYYSHSPAKSLSAAEARALSAAGLRLATVWESIGNQYAAFSYAKGVADGASASLMAGEVGQPVGSVIYFAVDFDAATSEVSGGIYDYFKGVSHGMSTSNGSGPAFDAGVYGSGAVCAWLKQQRVVSHTWLSESLGWRGSRDYADWNVKQALNTDFIGFDVDPNQARAGFGDFAVG